ncbi:hypothetical protein PWT90_10402 [Aphanocladium album]|nr:hypothetical protein PWT90_10402 [Aphanocladium album]
MASTDNVCLLTRLPRELLAIVVSHLTNGDIKCLRAASRGTERLVALRIRRVFLSANSRNINVLRAVADHEALRHGVTEIVWDDARLKASKYAVGDGFYEKEKTKHDDVVVAGDDCPLWFKEGRQTSLAYLFNLHPADEEEVAGLMPKNSPSLVECWNYYKTLIQDQQAVLETGADADALKYGLARFPSLKRVTLTPTAHGPFVGEPLYHTPMIRDFPRHFGYPLPENWPGMGCDDGPAEVYPWHGDEHRGLYGYDCSIEDYRNKWRGLRTILRTLAENEHRVTEFVMETFHHRTGINCNVFSEPSQECDDLTALLSSPGFRHIDLALFTGVIETEGWPCFRSGLLRKALAAAPQLEHINLSCTMDIDGNGCAAQVDLQDDDPEDDSLPPLRSIFPVECWPQLQHLGISSLPVRMAELVGFLGALPDSLRSVRLSHLAFGSEKSSYQGLLSHMRDKLDWKSRAATQRPSVQIIVKREFAGRVGHYLSTDAAADRFLYSGSETGNSLNPFGRANDPNNPVEGMGVVERNYIDPLIEKPYKLNEFD